MVRKKKYTTLRLSPIWSNNVQKDMISAIEELEDEIITLQEQNSALKRLQKLSYPYGVEDWIENVYKSNSNYHQIIRRKIKTGKGWPQFKIKTSFDELFYLETSLKIRSGLEYLEYAKGSSDLVKPTFLYYGVLQIYSALINIYIETHNISENHGMRISSELYELTLDQGFFEKLVIYLELIFDNTTIFSNSYWKIPELIEYKEIYYAKKVNLLELNQFFSMNNHSEHFFMDSKICLHFLNLFYFCSYSRYKPTKWIEFLKGTDFMYSIYVNTVNEINNYIDLMLDCLLSYISIYPKHDSALILK